MLCKLVCLSIKDDIAPASIINYCIRFSMELARIQLICLYKFNTIGKGIGYLKSLFENYHEILHVFQKML